MPTEPQEVARTLNDDALSAAPPSPSVTAPVSVAPVRIPDTLPPSAAPPSGPTPTLATRMPSAAAPPAGAVAPSPPVVKRLSWHARSLHYGQVVDSSSSCVFCTTAPFVNTTMVAIRMR